MTVLLDGRRLQATRKARGLTQEQLAERCDLSDRHVRSIETGTVDPAASTLCRICLVLNIPMSDLLIVIYDDED